MFVRLLKSTRRCISKPEIMSSYSPSKMTPIRVRGKKGSQTNPAEPNQHGRQSTLRSSRRRLVRRDTIVDINGTTRTSKRAGKSCSAPVLSHLERLPIEVLQMIFLECLNISLPQASPKLGSNLSSFYIKSQLFFKAFSSENFTLRRGDQLMRSSKSSAAIAKLQSSILQFRWMTLDFLHQCIPLYLEKEFHRIIRLSHLKHSYETLTSSLSKETTPKLTTDQHDVKSRMRMEIGSYNGVHQQWRFGTSDLFVSIISPHGWVNLHLPLESEWLQGRMLQCEKDCLIPEKLLRGPWTPSQCEFLESLIHAGATIDWIGSTAGEVADLGFQDALKEQSMRAIRILTQPFDCSRDRQYHAESRSRLFRRYGPSMLSPTSPGLGFRPTSRHLKLAAVNYDCSLEIIKLVKFAGRFDLVANTNRADWALFAWAEQKKSEGDARGLWLSNQFYHSIYAGPKSSGDCMDYSCLPLLLDGR